MRTLSTIPLRSNKHCRRLDAPDFLFEKPLTGGFEYQKGDQQQWHTNWSNPGARCYLVWSETGDSGMRFILNGEVWTSQDLPGWQYRIFNIPQPHCVFANCHRKSFGWWVPHTDKEILLPIGLKNAEDVLQFA
jgi:hypothetical protein